MERLTAGSTAAASKCLLITRKIIIPPPDSGDPPDGPPYFAKKMIRPLTVGTHELHLRTQVSASRKKTIRPPDCWDPPATSSHARKCVRAKKMIRPPDCWDPHSYIFAGKEVPDSRDPPGRSVRSVVILVANVTYILVDVEGRTCRSRGTHIACTRTYSGQCARK